MRIIAGADNAGFTLKDAVVRLLRERGHEVVDVGTGGPESVDYPRVGLAVAQGQADRGILFCSTGVGMSFDGGRRARRLEKVAAIDAEEAAGAGCRSGS
jgi:ribose 5-phosphate isomerase B